MTEKAVTGTSAPLSLEERQELEALRRELGEVRPQQAALTIENARLFNETQEALERETATSQILGAIARAPNNLGPVFDAILGNARRLCDASFGALMLYDGARYHSAMMHGAPPGYEEMWKRREFNPGPHTGLGRLITSKAVVHIPDIRAEQAFKDGDPTRLATADILQARTFLAVPMLKDDKLIGAIVIYRQDVRPFSDKQIELVATFAGQAAIAVENVRLFNETQEALAQQTASADILSVISQSPSDVGPVFEAIAEHARVLCKAQIGAATRLIGDEVHLEAVRSISTEAEAAMRAVFPLRLDNTSPNIRRAILEQTPIQIPDVRDEPFYQRVDGTQQMGFRSIMSVPLLHEGRAIGTIGVAREEPGVFPPEAVALLQTFASQAVIAIENARLLEELQTRQRELEEALANQTATAEVLEVISHSPTDSRPVFEAIAKSIRRLTGANQGSVYVYDGKLINMEAFDGVFDETSAETFRQSFPQKPGRTGATSRAIQTGELQYIRDVLADPDYAVAHVARIANYRSIVSIPMLREGRAVGAITATTADVDAFNPKQIALLKTFADQAVIAMNNARLFEAEQARSRELTEALEYQTAISEVLGVISRSQSDLQPVLDSIARTAARLCCANKAVIRQRRGEAFVAVASFGQTPEMLSYIESRPTAIGRGSMVGRVALEKRTVHIPDVATDPEYTRADLVQVTGFRSGLAVPLLRESDLLGVMLLLRDELQPFTAREVALVETFADQAVIAIENARLLDALQTRQRELEDRSAELTESLEYQTATSDVLGVISRSPNELQPVLDSIVQTASRLCEAEYAMYFNVVGDRCLVAASNAPNSDHVRYSMANPSPVVRGSITGRAALECRTVHVADVLADPEYTRLEAQQTGQHRCCLSVPLMRDGKAIGVIAMLRREPKAYTDRQIELVETFADQALIAINNVGLFEQLQARTKELARSIEELKSLGEVGQAVSSTLDMRTVLQTVLENAVRISHAGGGTIYVYDPIRQIFELEAGHNMSEEHTARVREQPIRMGEPVVGQCALQREAVQIEDLEAATVDTPLLQILLRAGVRSILAVPLIHQGGVVGALVVRRNYSGGFAPDIVRLLEVFAAQSAIAINNARLFAEIQDKSRQLELASQHKSQFLANMSHELRTPLNAILGYSELMVDGAFGELSKEQRETLDRIERNGRHLLGLINDVLDLSKIEAGEMALAIDEYSVGSLVRTAIVATEPLARQKGLSLDARIADELPLGRGDTRRLAQVLLNLIGNAIKFTDRGGVTISASCERSWFRIDVRDTGPGIAAGDIARIFEKFQQVDNTSTRKKGGTGLGLAISREFVQMHGGTIDVSSVLGEGAVFTIILPVDAEAHRETRH